jgi:hypothetical protein
MITRSMTFDNQPTLPRLYFGIGLWPLVAPTSTAPWCSLSLLKPAYPRVPRVETCGSVACRGTRGR